MRTPFNVNINFPDSIYKDFPLEVNFYIHILFICSLNCHINKVGTFTAYITSPTKHKVFMSKLKAFLIRLQLYTLSDSNATLGETKIDKEKYFLFKGSKQIDLRKKEFTLFILLSSEPGKLFTREYILKQVWGDEVVVTKMCINL